MMFKLIVLFALLSVTLGVPLRPISPFSGRIVGGEKGKIEDFPYQVSLRFFGEHICGGSIIDEKTIVTAAHCTDQLRADQMSVMVGSSKVDQGVEHKLDHFIQHPQYNDVNTDYDVSILKLKTAIELNEKASPVELQSSGVEVSPGTVATVSGWGVLDEAEEDTPVDLRFVDVDVISEDECRSAFVNPNKITPRMLCAKRANVDSCQGDSGGPLVANNKLIGVVSWGIGCARPHYPGVYTKVSQVRDWIEENRNQ